MSKLRPLGDITQDLEPLLEEMCDQHELQWGEIMALVHSWLRIHRPGNQEEYIDNTNPEWYYGPRR